GGSPIDGGGGAPPLGSGQGVWIPTSLIHGLVVVRPRPTSPPAGCPALRSPIAARSRGRTGAAVRAPATRSDHPPRLQRKAIAREESLGQCRLVHSGVIDSCHVQQAPQPALQSAQLGRQDHRRAPPAFPRVALDLPR